MRELVSNTSMNSFERDSFTFASTEAAEIVPKQITRACKVSSFSTSTMAMPDSIPVLIFLLLNAEVASLEADAAMRTASVHEGPSGLQFKGERYMCHRSGFGLGKQSGGEHRALPAL